MQYTEEGQLAWDPRVHHKDGTWDINKKTLVYRYVIRPFFSLSPSCIVSYELLHFHNIIVEVLRMRRYD